jgi:hypothetical protein
VLHRVILQDMFRRTQSLTPFTPSSATHRS